MRPRRTRFAQSVLAAALTAVCTGALAAETPPGASGAAQAAPKKPVKVKKPMRMDEPMPIGMMRDGMKKGDVSKAAAKKEAQIQPIVERERRAMPGGDPGN